MENVQKQALSLIKPTDKEIRENKKRINNFIRKIKVPDAKVALGGSAKKNTWLKFGYDADIFVKFDYKKFKDKSDRLSDITENAIKKVFSKVSRIHGSRDYFQVVEDGFVFEIIPILNIKDSKEAINITDISPLHALWVAKNIKNPDQVRLAKAFSKSQGVYGAESFIKGFSGYCIEILVSHYGDFMGFIEGISRWKKRKIIDPMGYHKNIDIEVNRSKLESPLVIIDPVQKGRNVAAALSDENYRRMISAAKRFLKKPDIQFFKPRTLTIDSLKARFKKKNLFILSAEPNDGKEDVEGSCLLKSFRFLEKSLINNDFTLADKGWFWDLKGKALFWFTIKEKKLSKKKLWKGPPASMKDFAVEFRRIYRDAYVRNGVLYAKVDRKFTEPGTLLKRMIKDSYIRKKVRGIKIEQGD